MSVVKRLVMGSAASWAKIVVTIFSQVLVVPIFLSHWTVEEYGYWVLIQTVCAFASIFSSGHQNYVGFEFLKAGENDPKLLAKLFYSAIPYTLLICFIELLVVVGSIYFGLMDSVFGVTYNLNQSILRDAYTGLIIYSVAWLLLAGVSGLAGRLVMVYGYFARFGWWGVMTALAVSLASAIAVLLGANLLETIIITTLANFLINLPVFWDLWRLFRKHQILVCVPDWLLGAQQIARSFALSSATVFDLIRQQGIRMFLSGSVGVAQMTAFATIRTLSNISLQGVGTITNPLLPEMMRYLRNKEQDKIDSSMGFVWLCSVVIVVPVVLFFQWVMPMVFTAWTRGKIPYDAHLFGVFSITLLIFSLSRPPSAILQGNNLANAQLIINALISVFAIIGVILMTPLFGILGAAYVLLVSELIGLILTMYYGIQWLNNNRLKWNWRLFNASLISVNLAIVGIASIVVMPQYALWELLLFGVFSLYVGLAFLRELPDSAKQKLKVFIVVLEKLRLVKK